MEEERFLAETGELSREDQIKKLDQSNYSELTKDKKAILKDHMGSATSNIDMNKVKEWWKYESNSILDVLGSWKPNKPLLDVKELRDQYRRKLIEDDFARQSCNRSDEL